MDNNFIDFFKKCQEEVLDECSKNISAKDKLIFKTLNEFTIIKAKIKHNLEISQDDLKTYEELKTFFKGKGLWNEIYEACKKHIKKAENAYIEMITHPNY